MGENKFHVFCQRHAPHKLVKIGRKYADFQISKFGTNAQPYYCLLDHNGNLLMKPRAYDLDKDAFVNFLKEGIKNFQEGTYYQHVID